MSKESKQNATFLTSVLNKNDSFRIDIRSDCIYKLFKKKRVKKYEKIYINLILSFLFFNNVEAKERKNELDKLFIQLKDSKNLSSAQMVENKIQKIWSIHPSDDRRGFRLTELLNQGSRLMNQKELSKAYNLLQK